MGSIMRIAKEFFAACETGKGWMYAKPLANTKRHLFRAGRTPQPT